MLCHVQHWRLTPAWLRRDCCAASPKRSSQADVGTQQKARDVMRAQNLSLEQQVLVCDLELYPFAESRVMTVQPLTCLTSG